MSCLLRASSVVDALDLIEDARLHCLGAPEPDLVADASPELAKRLKELLRLIARGELQVHDDIVGVISGAIDHVPGYTVLRTADRIAIEGLLPVLEISHWMLDDE